MAVVIVAISIVLRSLADHRTNTRTRGAGNQRTLDPTTEYCTQNPPGCSPDQCTLTWANTTLVTVVVVVIIAAVVVAATIIPPMGAASGSIVEVAVVIAPILGEGWKPTVQNRARKERCRR